jgi:hypothetical protein
MDISRNLRNEMENQSLTTPFVSYLKREDQALSGKLHICPNLCKNDTFICTVFHRIYKPSVSQVLDFCDNQKHRVCPFYQKGSWDKSVALFEKTIQLLQT